MQRVLIIGCPGAGKSTLARQLAASTGLPLFHLDKLYWQPGWQEPDKEAWHDTITQVLQGDSWILDGQFTSSLDLRLQAADTVILLDFPRSLCLRRVLWRVLTTWGRSREDMGPGCKEKFDWEFVRFIWNFPSNQLLQAREKLKAFEGQVLIFRHPREVRLAFSNCPPAATSRHR
jgi:adenylate kinase family enzyme